jgi:hypothetical protein
LLSSNGLGMQGSQKIHKASILVPVEAERPESSSSGPRVDIDTEAQVGTCVVVLQHDGPSGTQANGNADGISGVLLGRLRRKPQTEGHGTRSRSGGGGSHGREMRSHAFRPWSVLGRRRSGGGRGSSRGRRLGRRRRGRGGRGRQGGRDGKIRHGKKLLDQLKPKFVKGDRLRQAQGQQSDLKGT